MIKRMVALSLAALLALAAGCSTTVKGKVVDAATQTPLGDTHAYLHTKNARIKYLGMTDKGGAYSFELPDYAMENPGYVQFERSGYKTYVAPPKDLTTQATVALTPGSDATANR